MKISVLIFVFVFSSLIGYSQSCTPALVNGDFETPVLTSNFKLYFDTLTGWTTSESDSKIEFWKSGFQKVPAYSDSQFIELNGNEVSTIWQDLCTPCSDTVHWSFAHRGRLGTDVMDFRAGPPGGPYVTITTASDSNVVWGFYSGIYLIPPGQTVTRFQFVSVSASGNDPSFGNFLDAVVITLPPPCSSAPLAHFQSSDTAFCSEGGKCIDFTDLSRGNPTAWQWSFPGASPDTSSQQNPIGICYTKPGTYPVTLIVFSANGTDTLTVSPMVIYQSGPAFPFLNLSHDTIFSTHASTYQWFLNGTAIAGAVDSFYVLAGNGTYAVQVTDSSGCNKLSNGFLITSTSNLYEKELITVYPNPLTSSSILQINLEYPEIKDAEVIIYDVFGKEMQRKKLTADRTVIKKGSLTSGVYFVKVKANEIQCVQKIVIQ